MGRYRTSSCLFWIQNRLKAMHGFQDISKTLYQFYKFCCLCIYDEKFLRNIVTSDILIPRGAMEGEEIFFFSWTTLFVLISFSVVLSIFPKLKHCDLWITNNISNGFANISGTFHHTANNLVGFFLGHSVSSISSLLGLD